MIRFGDVIEKGERGDVCLLGFPHSSGQQRHVRRNPGIHLSPNCLRRFLDEVAYISEKSKALYKISNLGDVLRPRQFAQHKY